MHFKLRSVFFFNPAGDHSGRLKAAMGVYQCCLILFCPVMTGDTGRWVGIKWVVVGSVGMGCNSGFSRDQGGFFFPPFTYNEEFSSHAPCSWKCVVRGWIQSFQSHQRRRGSQEGGWEREMGSVTWVGGVGKEAKGGEGGGWRRRRGGERGGRSRLTKAQNDSRRVTQGRGASVSAPLPPLSLP